MSELETQAGAIKGKPAAPGINEPALSAGSTAGRSRLFTAGIVLAGVLVCALAISTRSYWLDETVIYKATMPTVAEWWQNMRAPGTSEVQQPLYNFFAWAWEKVAGANEFTMRAGNAPWFVLGLTVMAGALAGVPRLRWGMSLVVLTSPFAWYYLNETRPYAVQISVSLIVFAALYRLSLGSMERAQERRWVLTLCIGSLLLAASGLLAMLWLGAYLAGAAVSAPKDCRQRLVRDYWREGSLTLALLFGQGLYYLWTLTTGARASPVGGTDGKNVVFVAYELLGFSGLGPGRLSIRSGGIGVFLPWMAWLGLYGVVLGLVLWAGWRQIAASTSRWCRISWAGAFMLVAAFILLVGITAGFRVLGRHFAAVLPLILFVPAMGIAALLKRGSWAARLTVAAFVGISLVSCTMLRFSERHAKDDYRAAATLAREGLARGEVVWWNAAKEGALIYHVPVAEGSSSSNAVFFVMNPGPGFDQDLPRPGLVLASKSDVYDRQGALADCLSRGGFERTASLTAFTAWRASGKQSPDRPTRKEP